MRKVTTLFAIFLTLVACKKDGNNSSPNTISYSLDNSSPVVCTDSTNVRVMMIGGPTCQFTLSMQGRPVCIYASEITLFLDSNCDFTEGPIPYSTTKFNIAISDYSGGCANYQGTYWSYPDGNTLDPLNIPKGNLTLQLTYRKGGHIKGNVTGNIYGGPIGTYKLAKLNCDFDVIVVVR